MFYVEVSTHDRNIYATHRFYVEEIEDVRANSVEGEFMIIKATGEYSELSPNLRYPEPNLFWFNKKIVQRVWVRPCDHDPFS